MTIDVIRLARGAHGALVTEDYPAHTGQLDPWTLRLLERFAALVVEECAKVCDALKDDETQFNAAVEKQLKGNDEARQLHALRMLSNVQLYNAGFIKSAAAIRARKPA